MAFTTARVTPRSKLHVEKAKYEQQKVYNKRRKERPLKPRSSLNIQFNLWQEGDDSRAREIGWLLQSHKFVIWPHKY